MILTKNQYTEVPEHQKTKKAPFMLFDLFFGNHFQKNSQGVAPPQNIFINFLELISINCTL